MKKDHKKLQYTLIILLILIWGTIAYRMMTWGNSEDSFSLVGQEVLPLAVENELAQDSFVLKTNYKDPFLDNRVTTSTKISTGTSSTKSSKYKRKAPPVIPNRNTQKKMPTIQYLGYSINESQITRVRLSINQQTHTYKLNQTLAGVTVKEMYKDSVIIAWGGRQKTYPRKKH